VRREVLAMQSPRCAHLVGMLLPAPLAQPIQAGVTPLLTDVPLPGSSCGFNTCCVTETPSGSALLPRLLLLLGILLIVPRIPDERKVAGSRAPGAVQIIAIAVVLGWLVLTVLELRQ